MNLKPRPPRGGEALTLIEHLRELGACREGLYFADGKSADEVWATCHRPDWLSWWRARTNSEPENRRLIVFYCRILQRDITPKMPEDQREAFAAMLAACSKWAVNPTEENRKKARDLDVARDLDKQWCDEIRAEFTCPFQEVKR